MSQRTLAQSHSEYREIHGGAEISSPARMLWDSSAKGTMLRKETAQKRVDQQHQWTLTQKLRRAVTDARQEQSERDKARHRAKTTA